jgi:hypothetical protein
MKKNIVLAITLFVFAIVCFGSVVLVRPAQYTNLSQAQVDAQNARYQAEYDAACYKAGGDDGAGQYPCSVQISINDSWYIEPQYSLFYELWWTIISPIICAIGGLALICVIPALLDK